LKLFVDEDAGKTLGETLHRTGFADEIDWVSWDRRIKPGTQDTDWIPLIGREKWLVISSNWHMLKNRLEARLIVESKMAIVFIPNQALAHERLRLVLNKQRWLKHLCDGEKRPLAWSIGMDGRRYDRRVLLHRYSRLPVE
jgi:hypothetical protein